MRHYKNKVFLILNSGAAILRKENRLPTVAEQFSMIKKLRALFPNRPIDFKGMGIVDGHFCIKLFIEEMK